METANSRFGSELSNNRYSNLTAIDVTSTTKPKPRPGTSTLIKLTGSTGTISTGTGGGSVTKPTTTTTTTTQKVVETPVIAPVAVASTTSSGGGGGGGGTSEEKAAETGTGTATELTFFQKPVGKVTVFIAIAALLYGAYKVMKSKK